MTPAEQKERDRERQTYLMLLTALIRKYGTPFGSGDGRRAYEVSLSFMDLLTVGTDDELYTISDPTERRIKYISLVKEAT